ncbi:MAG: hypothetical protein IT203_10555 [Fimbriimonadaceae bacterium]|nr:hypothetical protein [Fimbriimonadaceae bacterium]
MKKSISLLLFVTAISVVGCSSGETPVETVQVKTEPNATAPADSMQGAIQNNPGMPQVAKDALLKKR